MTRTGVWPFLRNAWRQLTSMRTALILLFLLALAAVPGSLLPQRGVNLERVDTYYTDHPRLAPLLDRLGFFDVYASPWFAAIYLLLFTSLIGCILPRARDHLRALRRPPVDAPRRLHRLPHHVEGRSSDADPATAAAALHAGLRARRWRAVVREHPDGSRTVSAEKGYLKETGNLLMHLAMVAVLVGLAVGAMYGWHGNRLVVAGPETRFCNVLQQYDEYGLGSRVDPADLPPFCFELTAFDATYTEAGTPLSFLAHGEVTEGGGAPRAVEFTVNEPLRLGDASVYLLGSGYAPVLRYTDRDGRAQTVTVPFLPNDPLGTAEGVASFPDVNRQSGGDAPSQIVFQGLYLPTAPSDGVMLTRSVHPAEREPLLWLFPYQGRLEQAVPQSLTTVNDLITAGDLELAATPEYLRPGQTMTLDDGTTVEFLGTQRWITVSVRADPGQPVLLASMGVLLAGLVLSLTGRRRRVWFRLTPSTTGSSMISAGGLPRSDHPGFDEEFRRLIDALAPDSTPTATPATAARST